MLGPAASDRTLLYHRTLTGWTAVAIVLIVLAGVFVAGLSGAAPAHAQGCPVEVIGATQEGSGELVFAGTTTHATPAPGDKWSGCGLVGAELSHLNFSGVELSEANFSDSRLGSDDFSGDDLEKATFDQAQASSADFENATVTHAYWYEVKLAHANFTGADVAAGGTGSGGVNEPGAFDVAELTDANFTGANLTGDGFSNAIVTGAQFAGANFENVASGIVNVQFGETVGSAPASLPANWVYLGGWFLGPKANLDGAIIRSVNLDGVDLTGADLAGAEFNDDELVGENFTNNATLEGGTSFIGCNLENASFANSKIAGSFEGSTLAGTNFTGASFGFPPGGAYVSSGGIVGVPTNLPADWVLQGGYLLGPAANLSFSDLAGFDLAGVDLAEARLTFASSGGITGVPAALPAEFRLADGYIVGPDVDLEKAALSGADLAGVELREADLAEANLSGADLSGDGLERTDINDTDLLGATLTGVISGSVEGTTTELPTNWTQLNSVLIGPGANLTDASLTDANLGNDDFAGDNLSSADFQGSTLAGANFDGATWSETTCPDGSNSNNDGNTCAGAESKGVPSGSSPTQTTTVTSGTEVTAQATGGSPSDSITSTTYSSNPNSGLTDGTNFFDVAVNAGTGFTAVDIKYCDSSVTSSTILYWWEPVNSAYEPVEVPDGATAATNFGQTYSMSGGVRCVSATIEGTTVGAPSSSPDLDQLTGTVFGVAPAPTVGPKPQTITFGKAPAKPVAGGSGTVSATASSGLPVTLSVDASSSGVCSISGSSSTSPATVSYVTAGKCVIDANQAGDGTYAAAAQKTQTFTITAAKKLKQSIKFAKAPAKPLVGGSGTVSATASSGLPVTLTVASASSAVCSITAGGTGSATVSYNAAGSCVIDANQAGNGTYAAAAQKTQKLTVKS
jgi:uncharacterized protein YjbI with pentapeptide repeats